MEQTSGFWTRGGSYDAIAGDARAYLEAEIAGYHRPKEGHAYDVIGASGTGRQ